MSERQDDSKEEFEEFYRRQKQKLKGEVPGDTQKTTRVPEQTPIQRSAVTASKPRASYQSKEEEIPPRKRINLQPWILLTALVVGSYFLSRYGHHQFPGLPLFAIIIIAVVLVALCLIGIASIIITIKGEW